MQELYTENYKTLMREIKEDLNKVICYVHDSEDSILLTCQIFQNYLYIQFNLSWLFFVLKLTCKF